jgi:hypothetical protein
MAKLVNDLTGQEFNRLKVLERDFSKKTGQARWLCLCDPRLGGCGKLTSVGSESLRTGRTKSCGCWRRESGAWHHTTHGLAPRRGRPRAYNAWHNMIQRCTNESWPQYKDWGGRGITIDPRWMDCANFLADMGECPPGLSLERKDNNGNYCKDNCIWTTRHRQGMNTRAFKLTPDVIAEVKRLRARGVTLEVIGVEVGLSPQTVARALSGKGRSRNPAAVNGIMPAPGTAGGA